MPVSALPPLGVAGKTPKAPKTVTETIVSTSADGATGTTGITGTTGSTNPGGAPQDAPGEPATGKRLPLKLKARHPNGAALQLTDVTFNETSISVGFKVTNGNDGEIGLNTITSDGLILKDDLGNSYKFSAPSDNETVTVKANGALRGTFIFQPEVYPEAKTLQLITNSGGGDANYDEAFNPKLVIDDIPVG